MGSKGSHLYTFSNLNQASPTADTSAPTAPRRPFPTLDTSIGWLRSDGFSNYNSAQFKLEQHLSHGVAAIVNYTYSHGLGNSSNANLGAQNNDGFRDPRLLSEYGNLDFDVRHRFTDRLLLGSSDRDGPSSCRQCREAPLITLLGTGSYPVSPRYLREPGIRSRIPMQILQTPMASNDLTLYRVRKPQGNLAPPALFSTPAPFRTPRLDLLEMSRSIRSTARA